MYKSMSGFGNIKLYKIGLRHRRESSSTSDYYYWGRC